MYVQQFSSMPSRKKVPPGEAGVAEAAEGTTNVSFGPYGPVTEGLLHTTNDRETDSNFVTNVETASCPCYEIRN